MLRRISFPLIHETPKDFKVYNFLHSPTFYPGLHFSGFATCIPSCYRPSSRHSRRAFLAPSVTWGSGFIQGYVNPSYSHKVVHNKRPGRATSATNFLIKLLENLKLKSNNPQCKTIKTINPQPKQLNQLTLNRKSINPQSKTVKSITPHWPSINVYLFL